MAEEKPQKPDPKPSDEPMREPVSEPATPEEPKKIRLDPTRYGDWEMNGKCVDF